MPFPRLKREEVNKTIFKSFSSPADGMSDDGDDEEEEVAVWEETGAFPTVSPKNSRGHIFTDEASFENGFSSLEIVQEGSKETLDRSHEEDFMAVSATSSDTPAVDNRVEKAMRKIMFNQKMSTTTEPKSQGGSSGSSKAVYPFNIYDSLTRLEEKKKREEGAVASQGGASTSSEQKPNNTSFASSLSASPNGTSKKVDIDDASTPSNILPMSVGEESSVISEAHSHHQVMGSNSNNGAQSVVSRHSRKYMVRRTLSTSQQVSANPGTMLKNLFISIEQERHMHKLAGQNLHAIHNWCLFLPCIFLTLLTGTVVLVFEADLNTTEDTRMYASLFVGIGALVSVFLQAVSKMLDMGTRGTLHDVTANVLKRLSEDILLTLSSTEAIPAEYVALVSERLGQALDTCSSPLPCKVEASFSAVSDRMMLMLKPPTGQPARKHVHKLDFMRLYSIAYDELSSEIIHSWAWPFLLPRPRSASDKALRNFKIIITEGRDNVQRKQGVVGGCCPCVRTGAVECSLFDVVPAESIADGASKATADSNIPYQQRRSNNATSGHEV